MSTSAEKLERASKTYAKAAKKLEKQLTDVTNQTSVESERLVGLGVAIDWTRRASLLQRIDYDSKFLNKSTRSPGVAEMIRFTMSWSGMNALFSRPSILALLGTTSASSELKRFRFVLSHSGLTPALIASHEAALRQLLSVHINTRVPGVVAGTPVTTLHSLFYKYTPTEVQGMPTGKVVKQALISGNYATLDLALLIYAMRNWSVHGGIIGSSFRSDTRFDRYMNSIQMALADIHDGLAAALLKVA
ncbi:hypothetical protein ACVNIS_06500 [Sphaerotilaceae bacterium SBD11-9]